jgi:hypothetical protein
MTRKPFRILQSRHGSYVAGIAYQHDSDTARRAAWRRVKKGARR